MSCKEMTNIELGKCAVSCGVIRMGGGGGGNGGPALISKRGSWMTSPMYGTNSASQVKQTQFDASPQLQTKIVQDMSKTESDLFASMQQGDYPLNEERRMVGNGGEWSPKRWLDPLTYTPTKAQKPKAKSTQGKRDGDIEDNHIDSQSDSKYPLIDDLNKQRRLIYSNAPVSNVSPFCYFICEKMYHTFNLSCYDDCTVHFKEYIKEVEH